MLPSPGARLLRLRLVDLEESPGFGGCPALLQGGGQDGADHAGGRIRIVRRGPQDNQAVIAGFVVGEELTPIAAWLRADQRYHAVGDRLRSAARSGGETKLDESQVH